jgi:hypothetical protein
MSPTARTLRHLREHSIAAQVVERWCAYSKRRIDLFGCIDIVALDSQFPGVLGIQATTVTNQTARMKKILETPEAKVWMSCGNRLEVWGWGQKKSGKRSVWTVTVRPVTGFDQG